MEDQVNRVHKTLSCSNCLLHRVRQKKGKIPWCFLPWAVTVLFYTLRSTLCARDIGFFSVFWHNTTQNYLHRVCRSSSECILLNIKWTLISDKLAATNRKQLVILLPATAFSCFSDVQYICQLFIILRGPQYVCREISTILFFLLHSSFSFWEAEKQRQKGTCGTSCHWPQPIDPVCAKPSYPPAHQHSTKLNCCLWTYWRCTWSPHPHHQ